MTVLTLGEQAAFAALVERVARPAPPLPPVGETDAVAGFDAWLAAAPPLNRAVLRGALRMRARPRLPGPLLEALRAAAAACYYGDPAVMRALGYDAAAVVRRGRALRAARGETAGLA